MSEEKKGFFARLKEGLTKTRKNIVYGIDSVFNGFSHIDEEFYEELEEILRAEQMAATMEKYTPRKAIGDGGGKEREQ